MSGGCKCRGEGVGKVEESRDGMDRFEGEDLDGGDCGGGEERKDGVDIGEGHWGKILRLSYKILT